MFDHDNKFKFAVVFSGIVFSLIVLYMGFKIVSVFESEEVDIGSHEVASIQFKGTSGFWFGNGKVVVDTEKGTFVYPERLVTYAVARDDEFKIEVKKNGLGREYIVLNIQEEMVKEIRTEYAEQFGKNIKFFEPEI